MSNHVLYNEMEHKGPVILEIEVHQKAESLLNSCDIEKDLTVYLLEQNEVLLGTVYNNVVLPKHVDYFRVYSNYDSYPLKLCPKDCKLRFYVYQTYSVVPQYDMLDEESKDSPALCLNWALPNTEFEGLWDSLIMENSLKTQLLNYMQTSLLYSQKNVSPAIVRWNGVVLLHGPPGTGKTSLCKALAQKLAIRLSNQFKSGQLIEINTHSLFSKWYSESAKLVFQMFNNVKQWLECDENFVCLLIDEVESLVHSRKKVGLEPTDTIRVVNAVLTQLDQLQRFKNYVILATSNFTDTIDIAFADRADLKLFLGYPNKWAIYEILRSCIEELIQCQLIEGTPDVLLQVNLLEKIKNSRFEEVEMTPAFDNSNTLLELSEFCKGLSGRTLRKIPFLASTSFVDKIPNVKDFLNALKDVLEKHKNENGKYFKELNSDHLRTEID